MDTTTVTLGSPSSDEAATPHGDQTPIDRDRLLHALVIEHRARLLRFVQRHIGRYDDANDIAQQAFIAAAQAIDRFRGESELSTWLYGIAMNLVRNYLSRAPHRLYRMEGDEQLADMASASHDDPSEALSRKQTLATLVESMQELPKSMREVLMLVAVDELSYEEAAALLSVPVGTVRSRLSRARAKLKERLEAARVDSLGLW